MKTANRTKPKTDFGIEVRVFTAQTGMTVKELAERAGVKMPSFFGYMGWSCAILVPLFVLDSVLFFL